ncbi:interleukin-36 receptor antagonist protein-like [Thamnophis elegans]|uniref:interleukin-36 receptor antagonist protein-like n=1 Tax=Thamnophis elegans TaxID=35005 RepID=UPI0013784EB9|nr:interleukin-36 receptor antagonist protein-like [Thamnophis elegans]
MEPQKRTVEEELKKLFHAFKVQLMAVISNNNLNSEKWPIFMGLTDKTKTLKCLKSTTGDPQLEIEECNIMDLYKGTKELREFTFHGVILSKTTCSFESAEFPGWFLSTSIHPNMPVGLCKLGGTRIILFHSVKIPSPPK